MRFLTYNKAKKESFDDNVPKGKRGSLFLLLIYIIIYLLFTYIIIRFNSKGEGSWGTFQWNGLTRIGIIGIVAQLQFLMVLLMILNPVRVGKKIAISLTVITACSAIISTIQNRNLDSLAGVFMPVSTILVSVVIIRYSDKLNKQIIKITEYNKIITEHEEILHHMAYYDMLTGLPNRAWMISQINQLISSDSREKLSFSFVFLDLDNFKKINDTMGHYVGDEILKQVSVRWKEHLHEGDILGRLGGDEFALLICRALSKEALIQYIEELKACLTELFVWDKKEFLVSASFGITIYPVDGKDSTELMKNADIALYKAKYNGKNNYQFFDSDIMGEVITYIKLDNGLQSAVRNQEFFMVYQPIYECRSGKLRGYEALVRWKHSELGLISPMRFISIAEVNGTIIEIGQWILNQVLNTFMEFQSKHEMKPIVSINISVVQLIEEYFVKMITNALLNTGFDSRHLELEITESVLISSPEKIILVIQQLKEMGIRVALDDFGTGYASLSSLQLLKPNILKIDKSLIDEISTENPVSPIVGSIITLAHQIDIEVVAEGVEKEEQLDYLKNSDCDYFQGYLFSKPVSMEQMMKMEHI